MVNEEAALSRLWRSHSQVTLLCLALPCLARSWFILLESSLHCSALQCSPALHDMDGHQEFFASSPKPTKQLTACFLQGDNSTCTHSQAGKRDFGRKMPEPDILTKIAMPFVPALKNPTRVLGTCVTPFRCSRLAAADESWSLAIPLHAVVHVWTLMVILKTNWHRFQERCGGLGAPVGMVLLEPDRRGVGREPGR